MNPSEEVRLKVFELRGHILDVIEEHACSHPGVPVQAVLASVGEVFLQLALAHLGRENTLRFIEHLKEAAGRFDDAAPREH